MEKSSWDVKTHELYFIFEAALDGCNDDSEQKKVMISGSIRRMWRNFHCAETGGHSLEAVIGEELELEE